MASLTLKNINKIYKSGFQAVHNFSIDIENGEFIVLLGPSGCGKSTTLRMIAGLEEISTGDLILDNVRINEKAPSDRDIAMVFQNYALYGNMTVYENIGFGLTVRKQNLDKVHKEVMKASNIVDLNKNLNRKPAELSGGQRQRVALGRAIVRDSKLFLMDEPLSNLDAKLRSQTRKEIKQLTKQINATVVYVTHDQVEAMTMADRIVILNEGHIQQIGTPKEVYMNPANVFVAGFIGSPPTNFIKGLYKDGYFKSEYLSIMLNDNFKQMLKSYNNKEVILGIRPEHLYTGTLNLVTDNLILKQENPEVKAKIDILELLGKEYIVHLSIGKEKLKASMNSRIDFKVNDVIDVKINIDNCYFFDPKTENKIN